MFIAKYIINIFNEYLLFNAKLEEKEDIYVYIIIIEAKIKQIYYNC